jgi:hypothetical protein
MKRELLLGAILLSLAGCAALQAEDARATERMLAAAGFQMKAADPPEKVAHLQALAPRKIVRRERNGAPSYRKLARQQTMAGEAAAVAKESSDPRSWGLWGLWT